MLDLKDQLRRYGAALERSLFEEPDPALQLAPAHRRWRTGFAVAAVVAVLAGTAGFLATRGGDRDSVVTADPVVPGDLRRAGVFSTPTDTVLLFSDGIDGVTAVDLDGRLVGRRVIDGERAGDQPFRLTLTGDHLVVGWGEIYAAPLDGGPSKKIADATIYVPASEAAEVWTLTWDGGRVGAGSAVLRRVGTDGNTSYESDTFDPSTLEPVQGVPGGLLVNAPDGVAVWDAATETTGPVLGPGRAVSAASDGQIVAWCGDECEEIYTAPLERTGGPTAAHLGPGAQIGLSSDGATLAVLRSDGDAAGLTVTTPSAPNEGAVVADGLSASGVLSWSADGTQLFYVESSYEESTTRVGRFDVRSSRWEIETLPVGGGTAAITITPTQARSFFAENLVNESECPSAGGVYPSGRTGVCTFAFLAPDEGTPGTVGRSTWGSHTRRGGDTRARGR